jgi:hypothetical protein
MTRHRECAMPRPISRNNGPVGSVASPKNMCGSATLAADIRNVVRAAAKPAVKVAGLTGFRAKLVQSKRGPARGYSLVTVSQIHSRERAFKPVHRNSQTPPDPIQCILVNQREYS